MNGAMATRIIGPMEEFQNRVYQHKQKDRQIDRMKEREIYR